MGLKPDGVFFALMDKSGIGCCPAYETRWQANKMTKGDAGFTDTLERAKRIQNLCQTRDALSRARMDFVEERRGGKQWITTEFSILKERIVAEERMAVAAYDQLTTQTLKQFDAAVEGCQVLLEQLAALIKAEAAACFTPPVIEKVVKINDTLAPQMMFLHALKQVRRRCFCILKVFRFHVFQTVFVLCFSIKLLLHRFQRKSIRAFNS